MTPTMSSSTWTSRPRRRPRGSLASSGPRCGPHRTTPPLWPAPHRPGSSNPSAGDEDRPAADPAMTEVIDRVAGSLQGVAGAVERDLPLARKSDEADEIGVGPDEARRDRDFAQHERQGGKRHRPAVTDQVIRARRVQHRYGVTDRAVFSDEVEDRGGTCPGEVPDLLRLLPVGGDHVVRTAVQG